mgnify:CR=1 FL=1
MVREKKSDDFQKITIPLAILRLLCFPRLILFLSEIAPVEVKGKKGPISIDADEHPKPDSTVESIGKLPTVFAKEGTVTAANASGISDGAGALILASEDAVKEYNLTPLARVAGLLLNSITLFSLCC